MALSHTILATLNNEVHSGYDLWKKFSEGTTHYWKASQQQVYRELTKLETLGAIAVEIVPQDGRPDKKLYRITKEGKEMLTEWIAQPSEPTAIREEVLVKTLAAHLVSPEIIIAELKRRHQIHSDNLAACREKERERFANGTELSIEEKCMYLTLRRGIGYETEWVAWCEEAIAMFESTI
ncbi:MAG: PadR family transcriptional regulator [Pleurocapsa sp. MO_226.B13]|nr:PadR family transcriptional regulator [Pleurocapsa sp. MO_226.B13]